MIETAMQDDETTASELSLWLQELHVSHMSLCTILKGRKLLGWTFRGSAYCQLIRAQNKEKRLEWAERYLHDGFEDVVWTDETTVQLETHHRFCCCKNGQKPLYKPRPKHPVKVHVWAGISWKGRTEICIFEGIMNAEMYTDILPQCLVPFIQQVYPEGHRFMQDNDPKHTSWMDETTVQLETHRRFCCRKNGQKPRYKPRPKHPVKVHVWAGISWKGRTEICIFEGIMNAEMYTDILPQCLVPFIQQVYPEGHRFMQDNDPKHTSCHAREFFAKYNCSVSVSGRGH